MASELESRPLAPPPREAFVYQYINTQYLLDERKDPECDWLDLSHCIDIHLVSRSLGKIPDTFHYVLPMPAPRNATKFDLWQDYQFCSTDGRSATGQLTCARAVDDLIIEYVVKFKAVDSPFTSTIYVAFPHAAVQRPGTLQSPAAYILRPAPAWLLQNVWRSQHHTLPSGSRSGRPANAPLTVLLPPPSINYHTLGMTLVSNGEFRGIADTWVLTSASTPLAIGMFVLMGTKDVYTRSTRGRIVGLYAVEVMWVVFSVVLCPLDARDVGSFLLLCAPLESTDLNTMTLRIKTQAFALSSALKDSGIAELQTNVPASNAVATASVV